MPVMGRMTPEEKELAKSIRETFEGASVLNLEQVRKVIGAKSRHTAEKFVKDLVPTKVNGRAKYLASDVAVLLLAGKAGTA